MRKIKICVAVTLIAAIAIGIYTTMVSAVNVSWDFEDGKASVMDCYIRQCENVHRE